MLCMTWRIALPTVCAGKRCAILLKDNSALPAICRCYLLLLVWTAQS